MDKTWTKLYQEAQKVLNPRKISEWMEGRRSCGSNRVIFWKNIYRNLR